MKDMIEKIVGFEIPIRSWQTKEHKVKPFIEFIKDEEAKPELVRDKQKIEKCKNEIKSIFEIERKVYEEKLREKHELLKTQNEARLKLRVLLKMFDVSGLDSRIKELEKIVNDGKLHSQSEFEGNKVLALRRSLNAMKSTLNDPHLQG